MANNLDDDIMENNKLANYLADDGPTEIAQFNETLSLDGSFEESLKNYVEDVNDDAVSTKVEGQADTSTGGLSRESPTITDLFGVMSTKVTEAQLKKEDVATGGSCGESRKTAVSIIGNIYDGDGDGDGDGNHNLVHKSTSTEIYRVTKKAVNADLGIKVIADESMPVMQQYEKLQREQKISAFLPPSVRRRHVLNLTNFFDGRPGLWFRWESGKTLEAWLQTADRCNDEKTITTRGIIAMAVAQTLSQFHENGVYCHELSPKDIVLDKKEGTYVATFIDLSKAGFLDGTASSADPFCDDKSRLQGGTCKRRNDDLRMMGHTFIQIFHGDSIGFDGESKEVDDCKIWDEDEDNEYNNRKRGKASVPGECLSNSSNGQDLPLYLRTLISSLILSGHESSSTTYASAKDVFIDLKKFVDNSNKILRCQQQKQNNVSGRTTFRIGRRLPSEDEIFYGRQVPLSMLQNFFDSIVEIHDSNPMMAMISGCAGAGKSTLVHQAETRLKNKDGFMIQGKFDKFSRPDSVLVNAIDSFFADIRGKSLSNEVLNAMMLRIREKVGFENALFDAVPNLRALLSKVTDNRGAINSSDAKVFGEAMLTNLDFVFCRLIGAMSSRESPIVLFLDDLHWADQATLDLIRTLMLDPSIRHFGLLGCYRDNEVDWKHPLVQKLKLLRDQGVNVTSIHIGPIERECVNDMISDSLHIPPRLCQPLSTVVHQKAGGIILFVLRFLKSLRDEGLLCFSMTSRQWAWDLNRIKSKAISEDVVRHTLLQMNSLPQTIQVGLMSAACLGTVFDAEVLEKTIDNREFDIESFVDICKDGGYIQELESNARKYMWTHDQIHQAAYELIPSLRRESFHFDLGIRLYLRANTPETKSHLIFYIVDNLNKGLKLDLSRSQTTQIAHLNLQAGNKAISSSAFHSAANYLRTGISLLSGDSWITDYELSIQIYDIALEACFAAGQFQNFEAMAKQPLTHARCFEDKLNVYHNLVRYLTTVGRSDEALTTSLLVLNALGETIPMDSNVSTFLDEAMNVKELIENSSKQDLLELPFMNDCTKLAVINFLDVAILSSYETDEIITAILICRMMKISIQYGLSDISAVGFCMYGSMLTSPLVLDFKGAFSMGSLSLRAIKKLDAYKFKQRMFVFLYGAAFLFKDPMQASCLKLLEGYEAGFAIGDLVSMAANLHLYAGVAVWGCGDKLTKAEEIMRVHAKRMIQYNHDSGLKNILPHLQQVLKLMGSSEDVYATFCGITENEFFQRETHRSGGKTSKLIGHTVRMYSAVMRGDMVLAARLYKIGVSYHQGGIRFIGSVMREFLGGLVAFQIARNQGENRKEIIMVAEESMSTIKVWAKHSYWNYSNKLFLLEAEYWFLNDNEDLAQRKFNDSIAAAAKHKFKNDEGLAAQRAANFHLHYNRKQEAWSYLKHAKDCYEEWGATGLVEQIEATVSETLRTF